VVEIAELEGLLSMAALAFRRQRRSRSFPLRFVVNVLVAGGAEIERLVPHGDPEPIGEVPSLPGMAVAAENLCVPPAEGESRVSIVLEPEVLRVEAIRAVAGFAVLVELAVVDVEVAALALHLERPVADGGRHPCREIGILLLRVAPGAGDGLVTTRQRISALGVVEAHAVETFRPVAALAVVFELPEVRVLPVAVGALPVGDAPETLSRVAAGASEALVFSQEGKPRGAVVELRLTPRRLRVAPLAIGPETGPMRILAVAIRALPVGHPAKTLSPVALRAGEALVFSQKGESRGSMVEFRLTPRGLRVAPLAIGPETGSMRVLVAIGAAREGEAFPLLIGMATFARDFSVGARQTKAGAIVIEADLAKREIDGMAVGAARPQPSPMHVLMAGDAAAVVQQKRRGLGARVSVRRPVAGVADLNSEMKTFEGVACLPMIEGSGVPVDEIEIHSLVIGVAGDAAALSPVEPAALPDPNLELRVAGQAFVIGDSLPGRMTGGAVGKPRELRVRPAQGTRGDQGVELLRAGFAIRKDPRETDPYPPSASHRK
jgi:hypothetical protein